MKKEVRIKIMSKINNLTENGDSEVFFDGGDKVEVSTLGKLEVKDGVIYIDYEECTEGLEGTRTLFFFDTEHPERVNLCRRGSVCFDLVFEDAKKSSNFTYQNDIMPLEAELVTNKLVNGIGEEGGTLHLDYKVNFQGSGAQRTVFNMSVKPV